MKRMLGFWSYGVVGWSESWLLVVRGRGGGWWYWVVVPRRVLWYAAGWTAVYEAVGNE